MSDYLKTIALATIIITGDSPQKPVLPTLEYKDTDSSVVMASYDAGEGQRGLIGVVGPLRMDYSAVAAKLKYIADGLSRLLGAGEAPAGFGKMIVKGDTWTDEQQE